MALLDGDGVTFGRAHACCRTARICSVSAEANGVIAWATGAVPQHTSRNELASVVHATLGLRALAPPGPEGPQRAWQSPALIWCHM